MAVGEFLGGKLVDLLTAGLQRGVSVIFQKISRLEKIDQTIKGMAVKNPQIQTALSDFEIVLGTYQGKLTITVDAFLAELGKTGLIEAMAENALIGRHSEEVKILFSNLYDRFFHQQDDPAPSYETLYDQMMQSFSITLRELAKDAALYNLLQVSHKEISGRLDIIDESIRSLMMYHHQKPVKTFEDILPTLVRISKGLQQSYKNVRVETNRGPREVDINKIYIAPQLSMRGTTKNKRKAASYMKALGSEHHRSRNLVQLSYMMHDAVNKLSYAELSQSFRRVVVLGDPGGGKSTLCQKLCYDMAKDTSLVLQFRNEPRIGKEKQRLPIRVILRKFEQAREVEPQLDLLTFIVRDILNYAGGELNDIRDCVGYLLENGRAILAFDGLDEILNTAKRQEYVELVSAMCNQYPLCPVLVTSRLVGYDDAPLDGDFEEVVLEKLNDDEVKAYVRKFMLVVGNKTKEECSQLAIDFAGQTEKTAADLRKNPLLLGLMCWLYLSSGDVPSNRPEIYKECSILLFERWDQKRGILADDTTDFDRAQLFISLASKIYGQPKLTAGVNREWLSKTLQECFQEIYEDRSRSYKAAKSFVEFITGRAWVMSEVGNDVFSFTHQTFLEYFFARFLDDGYDAVSSLFKALRGKIVKHEWNEVSHLAMQLKTYRSLRKQEEAIKIIRSYIVDSKVPKHQLALMNFGARSLEYLSPSEASVGNFVEDLLSLAFERTKSSDYAAIPVLAACAINARERRTYVHRKISSLLQKTVLGPDHFLAGVAADILSANSFSNGRREIANGQHLPEEIRTATLEQVKKGVLDKRLDSPLFAALSWSWYNLIDQDSLDKFGISPYFNYPSIRSIKGINGITSMVLMATGRFNDVIGYTLEEARSALWMIAQKGLRQSPIERHTLRTRGFFIEPPTHIWFDIYESLERDDQAVLGAIFARQLAKPTLRRFYRDTNNTRRKFRGRMSTIERAELAILEKIQGHSEQVEKLKDIIVGNDELIFEKAS